MKKILLTIAAIALFAVPASAQVLSLWGDVDMTTCDYFGPGFVLFDVYLVLEPPTEGAFAAEYQLLFPSNMLAQFTYPSTSIAIVKDAVTGPPGVSIGFDVCQYSPLVLYRFQMFPFSEVAGYITIIENTIVNAIQIANCIEPYRPKMPCSVYNYFGFNAACNIATEESSWGAIKSMMN
jgi:hypothetical protein